MFTAGDQTRAARVAIAIILAISFLAFAPGIYMTDTHTRWHEAQAAIEAFLAGRKIEAGLSPLPTLVLMVFVALGLNEVLLLIAQLALLYASLSFFLRRNDSNSGWALVVTLLVPVNLIYASFVVPDCWALALLLLLAASLALPPSSALAHLLLHGAVCFSLFGARLSSLLLIVPISLVVALARWSTKRKIAIATATCVAVLGVAAVPRMVGFAGNSNLSVGLMWEYVSTLRMARDKGITLPAEYNLDVLGDTQAAIEQHDYKAVDPLLWGNNAPFRAETVIAHQADIFERFFKLVRSYPSLYIRAKYRILECLIGLCGPLQQTMVWSLADPGPTRFPKGYQPGNAIGDRLLWFNAQVVNNAPFLHMPSLWLVGGIAILVLAWSRYSKTDRLVTLLVLTYFGSYVINSQAATYRYVFPAVFFAMYLVAKALIGVSQELIGAVTVRRLGNPDRVAGREAAVGASG